MKKIDFSKYINIPYKELGRDWNGVDCYGLVVLIFREEVGLHLPDFTDLLYSKERYEIDKKQDHFLNSIGIKWVDIKKEQLRPLDVLVFNKINDIKLSTHVGIYIESNKFIHVQENYPSMLGKLDDPYWKGKLYRAIRYKKLEEKE